MGKVLGVERVVRVTDVDLNIFYQKVSVDAIGPVRIPS